jgi:hypothetical protein
MYKRLLIIAALVVSIIASTLGRAPVAAQQSVDSNGLKITPVRAELTLDKGKSQTVTITVENVTSSKAMLKPIVNDFVADDSESGEPRILLNENERAPGNSFKDLVDNKKLSNIALDSKQRAEVKVTVAVPANAASGGYYGAVRFAPADSVTAKNVAMTASVGTIFLIKVPGNITEKVSLASFGVSHGSSKGPLFNSGPISAVSRFKNEGNVHVQPFGRINLSKNGKLVESIEINKTEPRSNVLPGSIRKFDTPFTKVGRLGRYTVEGNFGYGSEGQLISAKATFYVIPYWLIGAVVLLILFAIFGLPKLIRNYNKRIIASARKK